jgi:hypothetical protein
MTHRRCCVATMVSAVVNPAAEGDAVTRGGPETLLWDSEETREGTSTGLGGKESIQRHPNDYTLLVTFHRLKAIDAYVNFPRPCPRIEREGSAL